MWTIIRKNLNKLTVSRKSFPITSQNCKILVAYYSRRSDPKNVNSPFKVVKSKVRLEDENGYLGGECGPNWELLAPRGNRFYFPNSVGPAWQGASTTIQAEVNLDKLVNFDKKVKAEEKLKFSVKQCPSLLKKNLHELFPAPEVVSNDKLTLLSLDIKVGDIEQGASKFVLAAREITTRLRLHGYWADFMNPFSGKPFYSWAAGKNLYKIDNRFRGLGMKLVKKNNCVVISSDNNEHAFSGNIFTNAPSDYSTLRSIIDEEI